MRADVSVNRELHRVINMVNDRKDASPKRKRVVPPPDYVDNSRLAQKRRNESDSDGKRVRLVDILTPWKLTYPGISDADDEFVDDFTSQGRPSRIEHIRDSKKTAKKPVEFQRRPGPKPQVLMTNSTLPVGAKDFELCAPPAIDDTQEPPQPGKTGFVSDLRPSAHCCVQSSAYMFSPPPLRRASLPPHHGAPSGMPPSDDPIDEEDLAILANDLDGWLAPDYELRDDDMMGIGECLNLSSQKLNRGVIFERNVDGHGEILNLLDWSADPDAKEEGSQLVSTRPRWKRIVAYSRFALFSVLSPVEGPQRFCSEEGHCQRSVEDLPDQQEAPCAHPRHSGSTRSSLGHLRPRPQCCHRSGKRQGLQLPVFESQL